MVGLVNVSFCDFLTCFPCNTSLRPTHTHTNPRTLQQRKIDNQTNDGNNDNNNDNNNNNNTVNNNNNGTDRLDNQGLADTYIHTHTFTYTTVCNIRHDIFCPRHAAHCHDMLVAVQPVSIRIRFRRRSTTSVGYIQQYLPIGCCRFIGVGCCCIAASCQCRLLEQGLHGWCWWGL